MALAVTEARAPGHIEMLANTMVVSVPTLTPIFLQRTYTADNADVC